MATEGQIEGQIEDVLKKVLGYTLGSGSTTLNLASPTGESSTESTGPGDGIDSLLRPDTVRSSGPAWLIADERHEAYKTSGSAKPDFKEGALTFWRWMTDDWGSNIEWVTVWVGKRGEGETGRNSSDVPTEGDSSPLMKVGAAWTDVAKLIPQLAGPGTPFDPTTLRGVNSALQAVGTWAGDVNTKLTNDINGIDTKSTEFRGSAAQAFRDRVWNARRGVVGLPEESKTWFAPLEQAFLSAENFVKQLHLDNDYWQGRNSAGSGHRTKPLGPPGVWVHPYSLIVAMLNDAYVFDTYESADRNHSGGMWETGLMRGGRGNNPDNGWGEMYIRFPDWSGVTGDFPVLRAPSWVAIDQAVRAAWANRVQESFAPSLAAARTMMEKFGAAQSVTLSRMPPQRPPRPPDLGEQGPAGGFDPEAWNDYFNEAFGGLNDNLVDGINGLGDGLNDLGEGIGDGLGGLNDNLGDGFNGLGDGLGGLNNNLGDGFNGLGDGLNGLGGGLNDLGGGLNGLGDGIGEGLSGLNDNLGDGFNGLGDGLDGIGGGINGLGDGLNGLGGGLNDLGEGIGDGLGGLNDNLGDGFNSLGDGLDGTGGVPFLSSGVPVSGSPFDTGTGSTSTLASGLGPQTLGDLSPAQLDALSQAGELDDDPLMPAQLDGLQQAGYDTTGLGNLGDLTPEQLQSLQEAGLLDDVRLTPEQQEILQEAGLLPATGTQGGGVGGLPASGGIVTGTGGGLTGLPGELTPSTMFPTQIDTLDVTPAETDPATSGTTVGDIRQPMVRQVAGAVPGAGGGFGTGGVTLPGSSGLETVLTSSGSTPGGGTGGGGTGTGGTTATPYGGMPFMPMGMGGLGGAPGAGQNQPKDRQRNTWLTEDEQAWGTDPECAPAVVGRDDSPAEQDVPRRGRPEPSPTPPGRGGRVRRTQ